MITQLLLDVYENGRRAASKGTPIMVIDFSTEVVWGKFPDNTELQLDAEMVSSGIHSPEETLSVLSEMSGIREDTLLKAAQAGRLMARKSGATWLSTLNAVDWAIADGKIRKAEK